MMRLIYLALFSFFVLVFNFSHANEFAAGAPLIYQNCKGASHDYGNVKESLSNPNYYWVYYNEYQKSACREVRARSCPLGKIPSFNSKNEFSCITPPNCSAGTELVGYKCLPVCPSGFERYPDGQCIKDCSGKQGQSTTNGVYQFYGPVSTWSVSGCRVKCPVRVLAAGGGKGYECRYTGQSANPDDPYAEPVDELQQDLDPPPEEPDDCLRRGQGYISGPNGITCVPSPHAPPDQRPNVESDSSEESGPAGSDGKPDQNADGYKKTDKTTKNNGDGTVSETKTETVNGKPDGNGGYTCPEGYTNMGDGKCQRQTGSTQDEASYCAANPSAPQCKGMEDQCLDNPNRVGCSQLGSPAEGDSGPLGIKTLGVNSVTVVGVSSGGSCPTGIVFPKGLGSYDWGPICDFASAMRPIIIAFAWLGAFFIVFGLKGGD